MPARRPWPEFDKRNLSLPSEVWNDERGAWELPAGVDGWGELHLDKVEPYAGKEWTDTGRNRDSRDQLKQRAVGEGRTVPCPPELTNLLHKHIRNVGTAPDGRLFTGERNEEELPKLTIVRGWQRPRQAVFTPEVIASPLAEVPYDLRHAAVSTWLNGGVPAVAVGDLVRDRYVPGFGM